MHSRSFRRNSSKWLGVYWPVFKNMPIGFVFVEHPKTRGLRTGKNVLSLSLSRSLLQTNNLKYYVQITNVTNSLIT